MRKTLVLGLAVALGCGDDGSGPDSDATPIGLDRQVVLASIANNAIVPTFDRVLADLNALIEALDAYAAASEDAGLATAAQDAWRAAMASWQELELMQLGPFGEMGVVDGGADLRYEAYSWPDLSRCSVDQATASDKSTDAVMVRADPPDSRGLGAIEYLLFRDLGNDCSPLSPINSEGTWAALGDEAVRSRRARHAHTLATVVRDVTMELKTAWDPGGGNFLSELTDASRSGSLYGSAQEGLNAVSDAMFYLGEETKDMKLGEPAGITAVADLEKRESRHANHSASHVTANLRGFQRLFHGGEPTGDDIGFDDLLDSMGAETFSAQMALHIAEAITAVEAIEPTLFDALTGDPDAVRRAYDAISLIIDDLKTMFVSVLDLEIPNRAAGDTD